MSDMERDGLGWKECGLTRAEVWALEDQIAALTAERDALKLELEIAHGALHDATHAINYAFADPTSTLSDNDEDQVIRRCALRSVSEALGERGANWLLLEREWRPLQGERVRDLRERADKAEAECARLTEAWQSMKSELNRGTGHLKQTIDDMEKENARLRGLVEKAYREAYLSGYNAGRCGPRHEYFESEGQWNSSDAKRAMEEGDKT